MKLKQPLKKVKSPTAGLHYIIGLIILYGNFVYVWGSSRTTRLDISFTHLAPLVGEKFMDPHLF